MRAGGFKDVRVLEGGLTKWIAQGLPVERDTQVKAAQRTAL